MRILGKQKAMHYPALIEVRQGMEAEHERIVDLDGLSVPKGRYKRRDPGIAITMGAMTTWFLRQPMEVRTAILRAGREAHEKRIASDVGISFPSQGEEESGVIGTFSLAGIIAENNGCPEKTERNKDLASKDLPVRKPRNRPGTVG